MSSSNTSLVTATAANSAAGGTHAVVVSQLATTSSSYSDPVADPTTLAGTTLTINYGDPNKPSRTDSITLPSIIKTLQDAANAINSSAKNTGVTASVVSDAKGQRLALVSKNSGQEGNLTVSGAATFHQGQVGQDAMLTVDGVPVDSATNTVTGATTGITYTLTGYDPKTTVQIGVASDTTTAATAVNAFVTDYNAVMQSINAQFTPDSSGSLGPLESMLPCAPCKPKCCSLPATRSAVLGSTSICSRWVWRCKNDGTLQINTDTLQTALVNNYSDFQNFFQSTTGYGQAIGTMLLQITDPTEGTVSLDVAGLKSENTDLNNQITDFQYRMTTVQQQLTTKYGELNVLLQQYPSEIANVQSQLGSLNSSSSSR